MEEVRDPPLIVCMENSMGEDIALKVDPEDDFQSFLTKARSVLGFDVDINSITQKQPVSLDENIYRFLKNSDDSEHVNRNIETIQNSRDDQLYILDDGTQIKSSQIQFENDDPLVDITTERIPFFKHISDNLDSDDYNISECDETRDINIVDSPVSCWSSKECSPEKSFLNTLPFKLISDSAMSVITQFSKYVESNVSKVGEVLDSGYETRSLIRENQTNDNRPNVDKNKDLFAMTREDVLNMFKDTPVMCAPFEDKFAEKRCHIRKTDPSRPVYKKTDSTVPYIDIDTISGKRGQNCFICLKFVEKSIDKLYFFDKEDQKQHRSSAQKRMSAQLKIICEQCLDCNFKPRRMRCASTSLDTDEFLIIKNNQQYVFKKVVNYEEHLPKTTTGFVNVTEAKAIIEIIESEIIKQGATDNSEFVKLEMGSDGEITKAMDETKTENVEIVDENASGDVVEVVRLDDTNSHVVEVTKPTTGDDLINDSDEADEGVIEFLGECQTSDSRTEMQCRFCEHLFADIAEAIDHSMLHLYDMEEGTVYACPLCDYGYPQFRWLRGHLLAAHKKTENELDGKTEEKLGDNTEEKLEVKTEECLGKMEEHAKAETPLETSPVSSPECSPIATRTRSSATKKNGRPTSSGRSEGKPKRPIRREKTSLKDCPPTKIETKADDDAPVVVSTEVQREAMEDNEEAIWIVQAADGDEELSEENLQELLMRAKELDDQRNVGLVAKHRCSICGKSFDSSETLSAHKCQKKRGSKRKCDLMPVNKDVVKKGKRVSKEPTCDPAIVTCNDCNESFTSKVRLKFHMQFHEPDADGARKTLDGGKASYNCVECDGEQFATETALFDHVHFRHGKQRRWRCGVTGCDKTFFLRATLTKHSRTHTDTRRYVCSTCGKRFLDKQTLDEHGVTHLQIKPFQCHICLKHLTRRSRLRMHLRAHEEELTPRLVHVCVTCDRAFKDVADAQEHGVTSQECIKTLLAELKGDIKDVNLSLSPTSGVMTQPVHNDKEAPESSFHRRTLRRMYDPSDEEGASTMLRPIVGQARALIRVVEIEKAFRCEYCEDVYYLEDALNAHRLIHKGVKNPFICHICKVSFPTYSRCTTHKTTHGFYKRSLADVKRLGSGGSVVVGADSNEPAGDGAVGAAGVTREAGGPSATGIVGYGDFPVAKHFLCEDCGRSYLHWTYLQVHRRMKHANESVSYKCNQCDLTFPNSWGIAYHKKKLHGKNQEEEGDSVTNKENYRIQCCNCDAELPNRSSLYKHRREKHGDTQSRLDSKQGIFCCGECGRRYASRPGLEAHLKMHRATAATATARCGCAKCGCCFLGTAALLRHVKEIHSHELSLCCAFASCGKRFASRGEMAAHERAHCAPRPHVCAVCGRGFRTASARDEHLRTHTGERPFACDVCGIAFRRLSAMRNHQLVHSAFACDRCPMRFRTQSELSVHKQLKHPEQLMIVMLQGRNPDPVAVLQQLKENGIAPERVIDISPVLRSKDKPISQLTKSDVANLMRADCNDEASSLWRQRCLDLLAPDPLRPDSARSENGNGLRDNADQTADNA